ncbi:MAG: efflux RND transporter periplasmic adaptor subunit [Planctomycetes bacterium]|nr:efflux RND transporter periplasmic adaptor subunit [Planctomycetota bacterium]
MRSFAAYLLAALAILTGLALEYPEWWRGERTAAGATKGSAARPVVVAEVRETPFAESLEALGTVRANESVELTPNRSDHVAALHFDDGQHVEKGDLLVELFAAEEQALLTEARAVLAERQAQFERVADLFERDISAQSEVDTAQAQLLAATARVASLQAAIADHEIRAPFAGTLGLRRVSVGAYVRPETVVGTLDDLSVVKADFTIPETWLAEVRAGMRIHAGCDAWPDHEFPGEVHAVDTRLDVRTRSATVRAIVPNPDGLLQPGMLLKIRVDRGEEPVLTVPESALVAESAQHYVLRVDADSIARRTQVGIGRRRVGVVEVLDGIRAGDRVVIRGGVDLRDGTEVQVVEVTDS